MSENEKTWVIGITDDLVAKKPIAESPTPIRPPARPFVRATASRPTVRPLPKPVVKHPPRRRMHFALELALTYLLGPFALLLTQQGRERRAWAFAGFAAGLAGIGMIVWRGRILSYIEAGWAVTMLAVVSGLVAMLWFSAWTRALLMTRESDPVIRKTRRDQLPVWLKKPWVLGAVGFLVPGLGLLLAGRIRRAAVVLWFCQFGVMAALALYYSPWAWQVNKNAGLGAINSNLLEGLFLASGLALGLWIVGWIIQALDGGRQAMRVRSVANAARGDWYALALLGTFAVVALINDPAPIAQRLDDHAGRLQQSGCQVIPLALTLAAHRCDPAQSSYAIQAMNLYDQLGRPEQARAMRTHLDHNLGTFVDLVMGETQVPEAAQEVYYAQSIPVPVLDESNPAQPDGTESEPTTLDPEMDLVSPASFFGALMLPEQR